MTWVPRMAFQYQSLEILNGDKFKKNVFRE
jgi:hypothetical protein